MNLPGGFSSSRNHSATLANNYDRAATEPIFTEHNLSSDRMKQVKLLLGFDLSFGGNITTHVANVITSLPFFFFSILFLL